MDDIPYFLKKCPRDNDFWWYGIHWSRYLSGFAIKNSAELIECIICGCPSNKNVMQIFNICIFYTKYYIYLQCLFNKNDLDLYTCLAQVKLGNRI